METLFEVLAHGLLDLVWWKLLLYTLVVTHITIAAVTIYLHRREAHRALDLHPVISHFFRLWLWLTTGMITKVWVAIHRKHHARCETDEDPHSPQTRGIGTVLLKGSELYRVEAKNTQTLATFGSGTPNDWIERNLYTKYSYLGVWLLIGVNVLLFGAIGLTVWAVQMLWIPITAAGIVNGLGHYVGYRNFDPPDASTNIVPWGIVIGGEELHNNHHTYPSSAKFSVKRGEFDIGWMYIRMLAMLRLAKAKYLPPQMVETRTSVDMQTADLFGADHGFVRAEYRKMLLRVISSELADPKYAGIKAKLLELRLLLRRPKWNTDTLSESKLQIKALDGSESKLPELSLFADLFSSIRNAGSDSEQRKYLAGLEAWIAKVKKSSLPSVRVFAERITRTVRYKGS